MKAVNDTLPLLSSSSSASLVLLSLCCLCHKLSGLKPGKKFSGTQGRMYRTVLVDNNN